ncbi:MAG: pesticidal protein Cry7Aa [Candidatus Moranbacteria bacterium]|nr:pesticidal protein Cry7Aa [Candidatus Moranbacteria bacterium]
MIKIENKGIILERTELDFENQAVLNPGCIKIGDTVHMLYRAVHEGNLSTIGYCKLKDFKVIERLNYPVLSPEHEYEKHGLEDPRIVECEGIYYVFYSVYDGINALEAYATTKDFKTFKKHGIISPIISYDLALEIFEKTNVPEKYVWYGRHYKESIGKNVKLWSKDMLLFPKKINGRFAMLNRVMPGMQIVYFDDFSELTNEFWINQLFELSHSIVLDPKYWYESRKIGGGCPPLETEDGWLLIYHAVEDSLSGHIYRASAALLDKNDPGKVIARLPEPLFSPEESWEKDGDVANVVFPTAAFIDGEDLVIFYGAADRRIAAKVIKIDSLMSELKKFPVNH